MLCYLDNLTPRLTLKKIQITPIQPTLNELDHNHVTDGFLLNSFMIGEGMSKRAWHLDLALGHDNEQ